MRLPICRKCLVGAAQYGRDWRTRHTEFLSINLASIKSGRSLQNEDNPWSRCPTCRREMDQPRLLDCLHPMCTSCVEALRNGDWPVEELTGGCPICEFPLPAPGSPIPPPHYPLQHQLLVNAVRSRRVQCYCDACDDQVEATLHCSTCLRNFCEHCGQLHAQIRRRSRAGNHEITSLWQANRFRRTTVCLEHPDHPLRFFCIACQQVTCSECMWRGRHRGHASEGHVEAAKTAALLISNTLRSARTLLDALLLRYTSKSFATHPSRCSTRSHADAEEQLLYTREARERIDEFLRLRNARHLLDAISLSEQLLAEGSDAEILSLSRTIFRRFQTLGLNIRPRSFTSEHMRQSCKHTGIFHCCTFCSSGGRKEATCACQGTMPGGYRGCGHGHPGHPGANHWSCCGSTDRYSVCPQWRSPTYRIVL